jgi:7-carboxy-7-deazaguanine synthase
MNFHEMKFNISEIFYSIQGEGTRAGMPCIFIRLQGCKLRCSWCDTPYALQISKIENMMTGQEIIDKILEFNCKFIEFTGGEPLEQPLVNELAAYFIKNNYIVAYETAGYLSVKDIPSEAVKIIDFKAPGSKMEKQNNFDNINYLTKNDEVKFVLTDRNDYEWAVDLITKNDLYSKVGAILFSPVFDKLSYLQLAEWILQDNLDVRMQIQMHKHIWHPNTRGV